MTWSRELRERVAAAAWQAAERAGGCGRATCAQIADAVLASLTCDECRALLGFDGCSNAGCECYRGMANPEDLVPPTIETCWDCRGTGMREDADGIWDERLPPCTTCEGTGEEWPYGPPSYHEPQCVLHLGRDYCDCAASDESDVEHGRGA